MSSQSAFEKKITGETTTGKIEGLLEHFRLPPKLINYIGINKKLILAIIAVLIATIIFWSFYGSYRKRMDTHASSALAVAMKAKADKRAVALHELSVKYADTSSGLWARIELAHLDMQNGAFADASKKYTAVMSDIEKSDLRYPLVLFALAQSLEGDKRYEDSFEYYDLLKEYEGYGHIAYFAMARLKEDAGNFDAAMLIYNNFLLTLGNSPSFAQTKVEIDAKIARMNILKAKKSKK